MKLAWHAEVMVLDSERVDHTTRFADLYLDSLLRRLSVIMTGDMWNKGKR